MSIGIVDLSAIFWRFWHVSDCKDVNDVVRSTLNFVRGLIGNHEKLYIAVDSPPYKRTEMYPEYKANRPEKSKALIAMLDNVKELLMEEGIIMMSCQGAEADDVIATMCNRIDDDIVVYGTDKDLLQIFEYKENMILRDLFNKKDKTPKLTLGIDANQVIDYLALVGDKSDNIPGIPGCGDKTARMLLEKFGNVQGVIKAMDDPENFKPAFYEKLKSNCQQLIDSYNLVKLDNELDLVENRREKKKPEMEVPEMQDEKEKEVIIQERVMPEDITGNGETGITTIEQPRAIISHDTLSYRQSLDPIGYDQLSRAATNLFNSKLYLRKFESPQAIAAIIMRGRELGIGATTSLDCIDMIQGKPTMSAQLLLGLVLSSGKAEYFDCIETTNEKAVFATKRKGSKHESTMSFTMEDANRLNLTSKDNWKKQPGTMLRWRCVAALARMVYPDIIQGVYATEEME